MRAAVRMDTVGNRTEKVCLSHTGEFSEARWIKVDFILQMFLSKDANQQRSQMVRAGALQPDQTIWVQVSVRRLQ